MKKYTLKTTQEEESPKFKIDYQKELNPEQLAVVTQAEGPCLVLAGAGSGKTRTLVYRVAYLLEKGIKPNRILLVTFTNKASKEMLNRVEVLLKNQPKGLWGGTFHHIGNRTLRKYGSHIGIDPNFTILDQEDSKGLTKACLNELNFSKDKYFPRADVIHKIISLAVNLNQPIDQTVRERFSYLEPPDIKKIDRVAELYQRKKLLANALDYDDLLALWHKLLIEDNTIRQRLSEQFQYILVDEYQDTNYLQGKVIEQLAGKNQNVLVVGDDSQSIYSFRGADINNILNFPQTYPNCQTFKLETNYRSTPEILALANESITHNKRQFDKHLKTLKPSSVKPNLIPLQDVYQQASFVCQRIIELQQELDLPLNKIAVLVRAHFQSLELEIELNKRNIPYEMRGGLRFFEQAHIKDVVAYLKLLNNLHDEMAWLRILQLQAGIGPTSAQNIWQVINNLSNFKAVINQDFADKITNRAQTGWLQTRDVLKKLSEINKTEISSLINEIVNNYTNYLKANFDNSADRLDDLKQLVDFATNYDSLDSFLADVALSEGFRGESFTGYQEGPEEAITLSTIHQAKGLEWQVVFIIGLVDGQFPHAKVFEKPAELEEERRLFYVASTRAQEELYLAYPIFSPHGGYINQISQFVKELPENLYEKWSVEGEPNNNFDDLNDGEVSYWPFED